MHKRCLHLFACFFIVTGLSAQVAKTRELSSFRGQYPFVYYTPNDGLVNSRVKKIWQDSRGLMYFITNGGLSVYDGTRFTNYNALDGLANEVVNDVIEISPDSIFVATNIAQLNLLSNGKLSVYKTADNFCPVINHFRRSVDGTLYVSCDDGLFKMEGNRFIPLPVLNKQGEPIPNLVESIEWGDYLVIYTWSAAQKEKLFLYNKQLQKVTDTYTDQWIIDMTIYTGQEIWVSIPGGIRQLDREALQEGKIKLIPLPAAYHNIADSKYALMASDKDGTIWLSNNDKVLKVPVNKKEELIGVEQGLKTSNISDIFIDREGTTWLGSDGNGLIKMTGSGLQVFTQFVPGTNFFISAMEQKADTTWLFDDLNSIVYRVHPGGVTSFPFGGEKIKPGTIFLHDQSLYLVRSENLLYIPNKNQASDYAHPIPIFTGKPGEPFQVGSGIVDNHGAIIQFSMTSNGDYYLSVLYKNKVVTKYKLGYIGDQMSLDSKGRLWVITRSDHLMVFSLHPEQPSQYLQLIKDYTKEIAGISPRSVAIDKTGQVWIGTRFQGVYCLTLDDLEFRSIRHFTTREGLTDNFIYCLYCDNNNAIWVGSQTGLDKIFPSSDQYVIKNITKSKNIFQSIYNIVVNSDKSLWARTSAGSIIRVVDETSAAYPVPPTLLLTSMTINGEKHSDSVHSFSYHQNTFSFSVAAPSFINEKSIRYSYLLKGSSVKNWSEPSGNPVFTFINLSPGNYELLIKADFPSQLYPSQTMQYSFTIKSPYWKTWWFRILVATIVLAMIYYVVRSYYRRILDKKERQFEQQQALEKERSRIATDMHDDLGAGLSKIRFLSETVQRNIIEQAHQPHLQNIVSSSVELVDKFNEIIWAMNEKNNSLEDLLYYVRSYTAKYAEENGLEYKMSIPVNIPSIRISGEMRRHIFLTVKEALHNIVKHADAKNIELTLKLDDAIHIQLSDDGKGFDKSVYNNYGNGLRNMEQRIKQVHGELAIESGAGTKLFITIPFPVGELQ
jgi:signal transduction histidine kinase/ligand-binding sensor domain-containing protein